MSITGGIKFFEKSKALLEDGAVIIVTSGLATKDFALGSNPNTFLRTTDSGDTVKESFEVTLAGLADIDRLILRNHNFKQYQAFWFDGDQYRDFCNVSGIDGANSGGVVETAYARDTSYYEFDQVTTTKIKVEVTSIQAIIGRPANSVFYASFKAVIDATWGDGDLTGTEVGTAVISGGELDLNGAGIGDYVKFDGTSHVSEWVQKGTYRVGYRPDYSGNPASNRPIVEGAESLASDDNRVALVHKSSDGTIQVTIKDSAGVDIVALPTSEAYVAVSGQKDEIAVTFDVDLGIVRVFINKVQLGAAFFGTGTRDSSGDIITVGAFHDGGGVPDAKFSDLIIYDSNVLEPAHLFRASWATVVDADEAKGSKTATVSGAAAISGGKLDLTSGGFLTFEGKQNVNLSERFVISFKLTPNYTGSPASTQTWAFQGDNVVLNNAFFFSHNSAGNILLDIYDKDGVLFITVNLGAYAPTAGAEDRFYLVVDTKNGATKLYIDETQFGATIATTGTRDATNLPLLRTGKGRTTDSGTADYEIRDFMITEPAEYTSAEFPIPGAEKFINQVIPTKELGTFEGFPVVAGPTHSRNARVKRVLSGKLKVQNSEDSVSIKLKFLDYPANRVQYKPDVDLIFTLFDTDDPFLVWLPGARTGGNFFGYEQRGWRLRDIYQMQMVGNLDVRYLQNVYLNPTSFVVSLVEAIL